MEKTHLYIGQILYRNNEKNNKIEEYVIERIATKYFYCINQERYPIDKKTLVYTDKDYTQDNFKLYLSKQDIYDDIERERLRFQLVQDCNTTRLTHLSLETLKKISVLIGCE